LALEPALPANLQFELRVVHMDSGRIERGQYDCAPELDQAAGVIRLVREFMAGRPTQFRERIPFLKRGDVELEWAAATEAVAFATFYESGKAATLGVFAYDPASEAGHGVLEGLRQTLGLGAAETEPTPGPLAVVAALPGRPEWQATLHLLNTSLAATFFLAVANRQTP
jgi:hypothetical protein